MSNNNNILYNDNEIKNTFRTNQLPQKNINGNDRFYFGRNNERENQGIKINYTQNINNGNGNNGFNNKQSKYITNNINSSPMTERNANNNETEVLLGENSTRQNSNENIPKANFENQKMGGNTLEEHNSYQESDTLIKLIKNNVIKIQDINKNGNQNIFGPNKNTNIDIQNNNIEPKKDDKNCLKKDINQSSNDTEIILNKEYFNKKDKSNDTEIKLNKEYFNQKDNINDTEIKLKKEYFNQKDKSNDTEIKLNEANFNKKDNNDDTEIKLKKAYFNKNENSNDTEIELKKEYCKIKYKANYLSVITNLYFVCKISLI